MAKPSVIPKHNDSNGWWNILPAAPVANVLNNEILVDTAIIGAGICGMAVAHQLGKLCPESDIALVDAQRAGGGASGRNAGFMLNMHSHGPPKKLEILRRNMQLWESGLADLRHMVEHFGIDCDWHDYGRLYGSAGPDGEKHVDEIAETLAVLGLESEWLDRGQMRERIGTEFYIRGLHTSGSALVNPAALMRGLAQNLPTNVTLYENSPVVSSERSPSGYLIRTDGGTVRADRLVLAAGAYLQHFGIARSRYVPLATYASMTKPLGDAELPGMGTGEPFGLLGGSEYGATIRLTRSRRLFVRNYFQLQSGAPTPPAKVAEISKTHHRAMATRWKHLSDTQFEHSWGGVMAYTRNDGAVFGEIEPGLFAILTNDVSPMTRGAAAGRLLADLMSGGQSDLLTLQLGIPGASRVPPRPFLDLGLAAKRAKLHAAARKEF